ncbi:MAG TPA: NAD-dependent epimerase/dehydratase family protein [Longimicrobiaceae bacterium]|nr:NAD-dependent epimerase/dehydratase family protein [Longimicrobiaceae bacterium]
MSEERAVVLGCGYVGLVLTRLLVREGVRVRATTRSSRRAPEIEATGAEVVLADVMRPETLRPLTEWAPRAVYDLVRPQSLGTDRYTVWGTRNVAAAFEECGLEALVYLSSTSVYGRRSGDWTDEATAVNPASPLGRARSEAERVYLDHCRDAGLPVRICRVPGIYGPGRTLRQRLESGAYRRLDDEKLWVSRIHVDDLARGLHAAWKRGRAGEVYLLCDDEPVTGEEYAALTASLLSLPLPPTVDRDDIRQELTTSDFERRISSRRCSNRRMREDLGVIPIYPSVREGLPPVLRAEGVL